MSLSLITVIGLKIFTLFAILLEHLISQLPLSWTAVLRIIFVFNLVSKLILDFFLNKEFWSKTLLVDSENICFGLNRFCPLFVKKIFECHFFHEDGKLSK